MNITNDSVGGEEELPKAYRVLFFCLYYTSTVLSIVGNVLVIVVLVVRKRLALGVRLSVINLAIADLLLATFCIPLSFTQHVYGYWRYSTALCTISRFVDCVTLIISALTLTAIGIDRYLAILYPLKFLHLRSNRAVIIRIIALWVITIGVYLFIFVYPSMNTVSYVNISDNLCFTNLPSDAVRKFWDLSYLIIVYVAPLVILTFVYSSIAWTLYNRTSPGNVNAERDLRLHQSNVKVVKMLILTVVSFVLCWIPMLILNILWWGNGELMDLLENLTRELLILSLQWVSTINCFIDPIIYCFCNSNFWDDLKYIFWSVLKVCKRGNTCTKVMHGLSNGASNAVSWLSLSTK